MTDFRAKAEELYDSLSALIAPKSEPEMRGRDLDKIEQALRAAATPPRGMVRDDQGVDRKLLGTLPVTADGCVVGHGAAIHCLVKRRDAGCNPGMFQSTMTECDDWSAGEFDGTNWFGSRESVDKAIEAAASSASVDGNDGEDRCKQCGKRCPNATCPRCQEQNVRDLNAPDPSPTGEEE